MNNYEKIMHENEKINHMKDAVCTQRIAEDKINNMAILGCHGCWAVDIITSTLHGAHSHKHDIN